MSDPVHVIGVLDESSGYEALYVDGDLKAQDSTLHLCDVGKVTKGKVIKFSFVVVELPDNMPFPEYFDSLLLYVEQEKTDTEQ
jgi:hypothetical protein